VEWAEKKVALEYWSTPVKKVITGDLTKALFLGPVSDMKTRLMLLIQQSLFATLILANCFIDCHAQAQSFSASERVLSQERFFIVAPFPPGGPVDTLARLLADGLQKKYNQSAVVENLSGAAGNLGMDKVKHAKPDGHTLLVVPAGNLTINPTLMRNFPFNMDKDFSPITMLAKAPNVLVAGPAANVKDLKDLLILSQSKSNNLSYASPGVGSGLHLAGELFKQQTGVDWLHVPYKGSGPALNDVLGGSVPLMFSNLPAVLTYIRSGKLLALGVTDTVRTPVAPDIPTLTEQGISGVVVTSWYGLLAPSGTPIEVLQQLAKDASSILSRTSVREQLQAQGLITATQTPEEFAALMRQESLVWRRIIQNRHIESDQ
jgi:tripartite-type tricarboxylate transporter receptor subunit TctC